jgi:hypothetical protein
MPAHVFTSISGWLILLLLVTTVFLPFLLRRKALLVSLGWVNAQVLPYLQRLRPHYLLGYAITGIVIIHAWVPMSAGFGGQGNALGLYLGTGALFALIGQVFLGQTLRTPTTPHRRRLRRTHFWVMTGIMVLAVGHILLDSQTLHLFAH